MFFSGFYLTTSTVSCGDTVSLMQIFFSIFSRSKIVLSNSFFFKIFFFRILQSKLWHSQLEGADPTTSRRAHRGARTQPSTADRRRVQLGQSRAFELRRAGAPVQVSGKRKRNVAVVLGHEWVYVHDRTKYADK